MVIRYSYDDFTTKGHGVIEGYAYSSKKTGKRKSKSTKKREPLEKPDSKSIQKHLETIHKQAQYKRLSEKPIGQRVVPPGKYDKKSL
jgi:hypothetical protein